MVWKTQKMVGKGKKTLLASITICGSMLGFLISWLYASTVHIAGRADWNYYAEYCTKYITLTSSKDGIITSVTKTMYATCMF